MLTGGVLTEFLREAAAKTSTRRSWRLKYGSKAAANKRMELPCIEALATWALP